MIGTKAECPKSKKEKVKFWVCRVTFLYQVLITFPCVRQNPTLNDYLPAIGLVSCNMDTGQINLILHSKDGSHLCTIPAVRKEWAGRTGPPISHQGQGHGTTLNIFPDTLL